MVGARRKARIIVLQTLYEADCSSHEPEQILDRLLQEKTLTQPAVGFARELVTGILQSKQDIDDVIRKFAALFPVEQLANIDRNILRLAIFEILFDNRVPVKASINEAVELAKAFGSDTSPKFVNGVLGSVVAGLTQQGEDDAETIDKISESNI